MSEPTDTEKLIEATAATLGLTIPPNALPGVIFDVERLRGMAKLLLEHPLSATDEALPILRHD